MNNSSNKCINAIAIFDNNNVKGTVKFHQCAGESGVKVYFNLSNLKPNTTKAIHVHEFGDERDGCMSLGSHWNPHDTTHGTMTIKGMPRHAGDLINNLKTDENGNFIYSYYDPLLHLSGDIDQTIIGRSVVIHDGIDDLGLGTGDKKADSLKTGNAGGRMSCSIIGRAKDGEMM
jgi:Cu-Zn family superoxide dismutase